MVSVEHLFLSFHSQIVFEDVSFLINKKERIALIGKNGAGKTTLLRILSGELQADKGGIAKTNDLTIGYLPQIIHHPYDYSVKEEIIHSAKNEITPIFLSEMDKFLIGLGFNREDFDKPCSSFSGGWLMRIELIKILLQHPDLLLLDEPTNHLDIESIQWLEDYLLKTSYSLLLVSHDKEFLNKVTTRTIEISLGHIYDYRVPYDRFLELRKERHEQQIRTYINQQKMIKDTETFIERFRYKATKATQVQARIKQLNKLERIEVDMEDNSHFNIHFQTGVRSGDFPLIINDLQKKYDTKLILSNVYLTIKRGEKVAFVGKNGEGKSTLVKCIMNQTNFEGEIKIGHNVQIGYFAQNQATTLDENLSVFDTIDYVAKGEIRKQIRDILGAFMFGGETVDKKVKVLSGGERTRLAMIKLLLEPCNFLILDEPTNHLDIPSKDKLKKALLNFNGTVICVSHDRDFLNGLVDKIYEFSNHKVLEHTGNIYDFLKKKKIQNLNELNTNIQFNNNIKSNTPFSPNFDTSHKISYEEHKKQIALQHKKEKTIKQLETEIETLEIKLKEHERLLSFVENQTEENFNTYQQLKTSINKKIEQWSDIQNSI